MDYYVALDWSLPTAENNDCLFSCCLLHYVCQLVVNGICVLFTPEHVLYSRFIQDFYRKQLPAAGESGQTQQLSVL